MNNIFKVLALGLSIIAVILLVNLYYTPIMYFVVLGIIPGTASIISPWMVGLMAFVAIIVGLSWIRQATREILEHKLASSLAEQRLAKANASAPSLEPEALINKPAIDPEDLDLISI